MSGRRGFGSETFAEFYFENIFASLKHYAEEKVASLGSLIEARIQEISKNY